MPSSVRFSQTVTLNYANNATLWHIYKFVFVHRNFTWKCRCYRQNMASSHVKMPFYRRRKKIFKFDRKRDCCCHTEQRYGGHQSETHRQIKILEKDDRAVPVNAENIYNFACFPVFFFLRIKNQFQELKKRE